MRGRLGFTFGGGGGGLSASGRHGDSRLGGIIAMLPTEVVVELVEEEVDEGFLLCKFGKGIVEVVKEFPFALKAADKAVPVDEGVVENLHASAGMKLVE
jgi:hypothetical protein